MDNVLQLGRWVPCGTHLHALNMACPDFMRRERIGLNGLGHEHYVVCGCRWSVDRLRRVQRCKTHPKQEWEY